MEKVDIKTKDGIADCYFFYPEGGGKYPAVIYFMDAFGIRQGFLDMGARLAELGYCVLVPNLYYRSGPHKPLDPKTAFSDETERERLMSYRELATIKNIMDDTESLLHFLSGNGHVAGSKTGCVGYCMSGKFALASTAYYPERIAAAVSIHGGGLANDKEDSPHLLAAKMKARIYIGVAEIDRGFTPEEKQRLEDALKKADVNFTIEVYKEAMHGFAVNDSSVFNADAAELHWKRLKLLFSETLHS